MITPQTYSNREYQIRVSNTSKNAQTYLKSMYKSEESYRFAYGFLFRTAFYLLLTAVIAVSTQRSSLDYLALGMISPRGIEDYFCAALYVSAITVLIQLAIYALSKKLVGRPDTKKHFLRETFYFLRDNLLYPVKIVKSLFRRTTVMDMVLSFIAVLVLIATIGFLAYGYLYFIIFSRSYNHRIV